MGVRPSAAEYTQGHGLGSGHIVAPRRRGNRSRHPLMKIDTRVKPKNRRTRSAKRPMFPVNSGPDCTNLSTVVDSAFSGDRHINCRNRRPVPETSMRPRGSVPYGEEYRQPRKTVCRPKKRAGRHIAHNQSGSGTFQIDAKPLLSPRTKMRDCGHVNHCRPMGPKTSSGRFEYCASDLDRSGASGRGGQFPYSGLSRNSWATCRASPDIP